MAVTTAPFTATDLVAYLPKRYWVKKAVLIDLKPHWGNKAQAQFTWQ